MRLDTVQFIHHVNYFGQQLQGAANTNVGDRPGQPPFDIELTEQEGMPVVTLKRGDKGTVVVPVMNVASYRLTPVPVAPTPAKK